MRELWDAADFREERYAASALLANRADVAPTLRARAGSDVLWLGRSAISCQVGARAASDTELLRYAIMHL